jgi:hypothetical protein
MLRHLAISAAFLGLLACGDDSSGPATEDDGTYVLRQLNDSPLPYDHEGLGCCTYLEGRMELDRGRYEVAITFRNRNNGLVATIMEWGRTGPRPASRLAFAPDSFVVTPFLLDTATLAADTLRVEWGGEGPGSPDQFQALFVREP